MSRRIALLLAAAVCSSCGVFTPSAEDLRNDPHGHLVWSARTGDVAAIRTLAATGIDLDASTSTALRFIFPDVDHRHATALQHAIRKHQVQAVRVLLEWGADPDAAPSGATPLFIAASNDDQAMMRLLLDAGADVNRTTAWTEAAEPGGPLWHVIEHALAGASGAPSPNDVLARIRATAAPSRP